MCACTQALRYEYVRVGVWVCARARTPSHLRISPSYLSPYLSLSLPDYLKPFISFLYLHPSRCYAAAMYHESYISMDVRSSIDPDMTDPDRVISDFTPEVVSLIRPREINLTRKMSSAIRRHFPYIFFCFFSILSYLIGFWLDS